MKKAFIIGLILITLLTGGAAFGQQCMTYQEFEKEGRTMSMLDSIYPSAIHPDSLPGPFFQRQAEFVDSWTALFKELMTFLSAQGFVWGRETWCHVRIYFAADGIIEYWLYNFKRNDGILPEQQDEFQRLITLFSQEHTISITSKSSFSQCGGVTFWDMDSE